MLALRMMVIFGLAAPLAAGTCEDLKKLDLANTAIVSAETVPKGTFTPPEGKGFENLPAFCRVVGTLTPSSGSHIAFEVWLPASAAWNKKFQGTGNGGFAGSISYNELAHAVAHGYATASTDTGHHSRDGIDGSWA